MRLFSIGLLLGSLLMGIILSCGTPPGGGDAGVGDQKVGDMGVKVSGLSVKTIEADCSAAKNITNTQRGIELTGVDWEKVVGVTSLLSISGAFGKDFTSKAPQQLHRRKSDGKVFYFCVGSDQSTHSVMLLQR